MSETLLLIAGGIGILLAGTGIGYWFANTRIQGRIAEAEEIRDKFDAYRRDVTEHFGRTAEHFQAIGKQYRDLYEHLASGADSFCDADTLDEKLVYEPASATSAAAANPDEPPGDRPRDYAEGEYADDETEAATAADEPADKEADKSAAETEAPTPADDNGKTPRDEARRASGTDAGDATESVDDLKPEVKPDADEDKQPTLH